MRQWIWSALAQITLYRLFGVKPLCKTMLGYYYLDPYEQISMIFFFYQNTKHFIHENAFENTVCQDGGHCVQGEMSLNASAYHTCYDVNPASIPHRLTTSLGYGWNQGTMHIVLVYNTHLSRFSLVTFVLKPLWLIYLKMMCPNQGGRI